MDMIPRTLTKTIIKNQKLGFITIIYGPRRVGKTILLKQLAEWLEKPNIWFDGDHQETRNALISTAITSLTKLVRQHEIVFIDEAQRITNIGLSLKILIDAFPEKNFFVSGSSSLMLSHGIQEPLTGRNQTYKLYPLSTEELTANVADFQKSALLDEQLRFGGYPYLQQLTTANEKQQYLQSIVDDYLFKDVLLLKTIESPENLRKLATLLAFQIGSEASLNELSNRLGIDVKTVNRYLSLLKQSFVIFELGAFAKNLRKEVAKSKKYYFWDLGIRNALTQQFLPLDVRPDKGQLWENFLAVERIKKHHYTQNSVRYYFWRTYEKAEIDWIEVKDGEISAYEFKWKPQRSRTPKAFRQTYRQTAQTISPENYLQDFL